MDEEQQNEEPEGEPEVGTQKSEGGTQKPDSRLVAIEMPDCGHEWCLGEVLRGMGLENGVCCPRPLPWAKGTRRLKYLPGWQKLCKEYGCKPTILVSGTRRKKWIPEELKRWKLEVTEAKLLWSYLAPILSFPSVLKYEDELPKVFCQCKADCCKLKLPPPPEGVQNKGNKGSK